MPHGLDVSGTRNTKAIGDASEAAVLAALVGAGITVLQPFGDNERFDLVAYEDGRFVRLQVKTGRVVRGCVRASARSVNAYATRRYCEDEIDAFAVWCSQTGRMYVLPVGETPAEIVLRLEAPANGQARNIRWARDHEFNGSLTALLDRNTQAAAAAAA